MKARSQLWRPPDKRKGAQENLGAHECANPSGIGNKNNTRIVPVWQCGLPAELIERIARFRQSQPSVQLPATMQREIRRNWTLHARATR